MLVTRRIKNCFQGLGLFLVFMMLIRNKLPHLQAGRTAADSGWWSEDGEYVYAALMDKPTKINHVEDIF